MRKMNKAIACDVVQCAHNCCGRGCDLDSIKICCDNDSGKCTCCGSFECK